MKKSWLIKSLLILICAASVLAAGAATLLYAHFSKGLPQIISPSDYHPRAVTNVVAGSGKEQLVIGEFFKERRYLVPYEKIPQIVVQSFISAEDDRFFEHSGFNIASMIRASIANFRAGHVVQGGSTITQQVAKSILHAPERTFDRKIKEVILASRMEKNLTKQQILYLYLNEIYLGHGAYGVQAAARTYFRKDVGDITVAEAALLAGLPQAPSKYSPLLNPKRAKERQLYVLKRMYENKYISQAQMTEAAAQPLKIYHDEDLNLRYAAYLVEYIRKYLIEKYGEEAVFEEGLTAYVPTTPDLLAAARKSLRSGLREVDKRIGYRGALDHLSSAEAIEKFLREERVQLIDRKVHCQILTPDGRIDPIEAMHATGIPTDAKLLDLDELYKAVVIGVDDHKKSATVMVGAVRAEMPMTTMRWARWVREDKSGQVNHGPDPEVPSRVVKRGDVVLVRVTTNADDATMVALEQEPQVQGALFSLEAQTGYMLAMEGGYDFEESEFNRAVQAQRQPGSSFKPIIYSAALEKGYTPASVIVDSPIVYEDKDSFKWKPSNFEEKFYGDTTFRQALIKSRNVPTIKIVQAIQVPYLIDYAKRLGFTSQFSPDLSISLGSTTVSPMDMTRIYSLFPRLGRKVTPIIVSKVVDQEGHVLEEQKPQPMPAEPHIARAADPTPGPSGVPVTAGTASAVQIPSYPLPDDPDQVLDPRVAYVMTHLMNEVVNYGTGHEAKNLGRAAAGKTGTTNDYIDAWFMGFTPHVVTGVWVGFDNQRSIGPGETGARAALPIWLGYMREAVKRYPDADFTIPPGVVFASIDANSGKLAAPNSSTAIKEAFIEGTQPSQAGDSTKVSPETQSEFFKEDTE